MKLREAEIVAVDFETTGAAKENENLPWQIGCARFKNGSLCSGECLSLYLKIPITHKFNKYTPGRWAEKRVELAASKSLQEEWPVLSGWLEGCLLAAHNVQVERSILTKNFPLHTFGPWIDTLKIARMAFPGMESKSLSNLLEHFSLMEKVIITCPGLAPHDACFDAVGCACLLEYFASLSGWGDVDIDCIASGVNRR